VQAMRASTPASASDRTENFIRRDRPIGAFAAN
jgi:hypothetical protein